MCGLGVAVGCKSGHKKPLMCGAGWLLGLEGIKGLEGLEGLEGLKGLEGLRAGKRQTWMPIRSHWCVALGWRLAARVATRSYWCVARGGCWLQDEACQVNVLRVFKGLEGLKRLECLEGLESFKGLEGLRAGKRQGFTVVKGLEGFKRLEGLEGLERFRAGKRQTWMPIRSHWCVALGCLLAARVATRSHWCVARGGCWLQDEACQVTVLRVLRFLRVWRVLSAWRVWRVWGVWSVLGRANGRLGRP